MLRGRAAGALMAAPAGVDARSGAGSAARRARSGPSACATRRRSRSRAATCCWSSSTSSSSTATPRRTRCRSRSRPARTARRCSESTRRSRSRASRRPAIGRAGVLYDAVVDPAVTDALLDAIGGRRRFRAGRGEITASPTRLFRQLRGPEAHLPPTGTRTEQSNSSVVLGDRLMLKLFRRLEEGINPDLEVTRFLTDRAFPNVPAVAGWVAYRVPDREPSALAILQEYVPNEGDLWTYTLDQLDDFLERAAAVGEASGTAGHLGPRAARRGRRGRARHRAHDGRHVPRHGVAARAPDRRAAPRPRERPRRSATSRPSRTPRSTSVRSTSRSATARARRSSCWRAGSGRSRRRRVRTCGGSSSPRSGSRRGSGRCSRRG